MNIAVLAGGYSPERDVSLTSGSLIANALIDEGYNVCLADVYLGIKDENITIELFNKEKKTVHKVDHDVPDLVSLKEMSGNGDALIGKGIVELCICLHQPLGQKQGDDTEDKCTPLHKAAGQDRMHCFSFSSDQPQQADHCGGHHTQKRPGRPAEVLPEGRDTQHQTEEDQHQHSTDPVKVLQWASLGVLFSGSQYTGNESDGADCCTDPQHHAPVVGRDDQTAQSRPENN